MQWSLLVIGHGGTVALRGGAPTVSGHGKARRGAHEHHGDDSNLSSLSRVRVEAPMKVSSVWWCDRESTTALVIVFHIGEATIHSNIMPQASCNTSGVSLA